MILNLCLKTYEEISVSDNKQAHYYVDKAHGVVYSRHSHEFAKMFRMVDDSNCKRDNIDRYSLITITDSKKKGIPMIWVHWGAFQADNEAVEKGDYSLLREKSVDNFYTYVAEKEYEMHFGIFSAQEDHARVDREIDSAKKDFRIFKNDQMYPIGGDLIVQTYKDFTHWKVLSRNLHS